MVTSAFRDIIDLSKLTPVAAGSRRKVYLLDHCDPPLVLKVVDYAREASRMSPTKRIIRKWFPLTHHRMVLTESAHQMRVSLLSADAAPLLPIPQFRGLVQTSQGQGALWEAVVGEDGALAPSLAAEMKRLGTIESYLPLINQLVRQILDLDILILDFHPNNVVVTGWADGPALMLVDGFGTAHIIPIRQVFPRLNRKRFFAQCKIFARKAKCVWHEETRTFAMP